MVKLTRLLGCVLLCIGVPFVALPCYRSREGVREGRPGSLPRWERASDVAVCRSVFRSVDHGPGECPASGYAAAPTGVVVRAWTRGPAPVAVLLSGLGNLAVSVVAGRDEVPPLTAADARRSCGLPAWRGSLPGCPQRDIQPCNALTRNLSASLPIARCDVGSCWTASLASDFSYAVASTVSPNARHNARDNSAQLRGMERPPAGSQRRGPIS
jgi:hypothetical protein